MWTRAHRQSLGMWDPGVPHMMQVSRACTHIWAMHVHTHGTQVPRMDTSMQEPGSWGTHTHTGPRCPGQAWTDITDSCSPYHKHMHENLGG